MRIIAGIYKGRKLTGIKGRDIRPTSDKIREALFSILSQRIENALVLDLFAGTGAFGIEALSRGAAKSFFIEKSKQAVKIIHKNLEILSIKEEAEVFFHDACAISNSNIHLDQKFDLIFMDPPYNKGLIPKLFKNVNLLTMTKDDSIIIAEHSVREDNLGDVTGFEQYDRRTYGETLISFFRKKQNST
jgi:16S rRNA (guanine966-N2)-methyltransferase